MECSTATFFDQGSKCTSSTSVAKCLINYELKIKFRYYFLSLHTVCNSRGKFVPKRFPSVVQGLLKPDANNAETHTQRRNWQGGNGAIRTPGKLNVKTGTPLVDILIFSVLWVVFFLRFSECFRFFKLVYTSTTSRFPIISYLFFLVLASGPPTVTTWPLSAKLCRPWLKTLVMPLRIHY